MTLGKSIDSDTGDAYVELTTFIPSKTYHYAQFLAAGMSVEQMIWVAAERFLREKPWDTQEYQWAWRESLHPERDTETDITSVNMRFSHRIAEQLANVASEHKIPLDSLCYTLLLWWTWGRY